MRRVFSCALLALAVLVRAFPAQAAFPYTALSRLVETATTRHPGVVLLEDLTTRQRYVFGSSPLLHERYRPGSVFKLVLAELAESQNIPTHYRCTGKLAGHRCWRPSGHGFLDLPKALELSCNLFFIQLGQSLDFSRILERLRDYGWPTETLEHLSAKQREYFFIGDAPQFKVTPEEMLSFWRLYLEKLEKNPDSAVLQGLNRSTQRGTAKALRFAGSEMLAKTGTADSERAGFRTQAWLLAASSARKPRFALVVFLQHAHGFDEAAELGEKILALLGREALAD